MTIADHPHLVRAVREAVAAVRRDPRRRRRGWFDSHCVVNYLDAYRNEELNDIIDQYQDNQDPTHRATIQIGCFIRDYFGQSKEKYREGISHRRITLRDGSPRDGDCAVSRWEIIPATELGNSNDKFAHLCEEEIDSGEIITDLKDLF